FRVCVRDLAKVYGVEYVFIGVFKDEKKNSIETLALWANGDYGENFTYELEGTPCQDVLDLKMEFVPRGASLIYSKDDMLVDMGIETYFGAMVKSGV
ncbi:MAG: sensor histidine kinase, partial [Candidatus Poribacteria bacterium]|nr:sensor histidine kinase [Candidatus Poribacteria bacterium]